MKTKTLDTNKSRVFVFQTSEKQISTQKTGVVKLPHPKESLGVSETEVYKEK